MGGGRIVPTRTGLSGWGLRLLTVLVLALAASLAWTWIQTFYRGVGGSTKLSYTPFDAPALPHDRLFYADPIVGHHYFGDFQVPLSYARDLRDSISPYLRRAPEQYPPFTQVLFVPLSFLPLHVSVWIYLGLSAAVFLVPLWLLMDPLGFEHRILFLVPAAILTTGFVAFMDRGNNVGLMVGLVAWSLWAWKSERNLLCAILLVAAIALKAYPAALLVVPLALRRYRFTVSVAAGAFAASLIPVLFYPGGLSRNLHAVGPALRGQYYRLDQLSSWSLYSVIPKTSGLVLGPLRVNDLLAPKGPFLWLPSILYVAALFFVIARGRIPQWCWGPLALATIQLLVPISFVYTTAWASVAAVWYTSGHLVDIEGYPDPAEDGGRFLALRILVLTAIAMTLTPSIFSLAVHSGFSTPLTRFLSPLLLFVTLAVAVVQSLTPMHREVSTPSVA